MVKVLRYTTDDEIQQSTALRWLAEFLSFAHEVMVPFTPRLIPAILPNLAHHVSMIQSAAKYTNKLLYNVIQNLPSPSEPPPPRVSEKLPEKAPSRLPRSPTPTTGMSSAKQSQGEIGPEVTNPPPLLTRNRSAVDTSLISRLPAPETPPPTGLSSGSRPPSPVSTSSQTGIAGNQIPILEDTDLFDYQATVNELTIQFLSEYEETRVATLKWLIMLHQKAPKKVCLLSSILTLLPTSRTTRFLPWTTALSLHF